MEAEIYYKRSTIQHKSEYNKEAENLIESDNPEKEILKGITIKPRTDFSYNHNKCGPFNGNRTEKRLCRCFVCYNKKEYKTNCDKCDINKLHNLSKELIGNKGIIAHFEDFELPVSPDGKDKIGEVDLVLNYNDTNYICEFKPLWNKESLLRMIAEIVTYASFLRNTKYENFKKAIVFMEGSEQDKQFTNNEYKWYKSEYIDKLIEKFDITVFRINDVNGKYIITKLN